MRPPLRRLADLIQQQADSVPEDIAPQSATDGSGPSARDEGTEARSASDAPAGEDANHKPERNTG